MIKITNMGMMINGNCVETESELTALLNEFYKQVCEKKGEEYAFELFEKICTLATNGFETPLFVGRLDLEVSFIGGIRMQGCEIDIMQALGAATCVIYKKNIERMGEDNAKEWLAFIGRLATMDSEELSKEVEEMLADTDEDVLEELADALIN